MLSRFITSTCNKVSIARCFVCVLSRRHKQSAPGEAVKSYIRFVGPDGAIRYGQPEGGVCPKVAMLLSFD